ncbi:TonB-dependent hemoglobin/transferrin/lactoferrin family receptor [Nitratireductor luteus]|uniref:TonB-dependent hemoglobin/transferrin/lactoferrin family receptor n=1 Tax=Nitratireductor luteus TaxID=2976980 RepID=UPI00223FAAB8|nr:TonB-dependent hemoglobin/transferrin/lactoferrin family receptor [Nitratireductor luteus]
MTGLLARNRLIALGGAGALSFLLLPTASAQQAADNTVGVTALQRLIVGAGVEKVAIDTPQSVTVIEQEDIDEAQATNLGDVLKRIPGVNTSGSDRAFGQTFNIRGIGAPESAGEEGRIIVTVDGATKFYEQYRMGGFFSDPELYKRVEVLRGPASSTLYGSGALGGVIRFETKDASDFIADGQTGALRLKSGYNSNKDGWLGSAILAQRFGNADFLIAGNYRKADAYETGDGTIISSSDFKAWSGLAKGTFKIGEEGTLRVSYQQWDSDAPDQDYAQVGGPVMGGTVSGFGTVDRHVIDRTGVVSYENPFSDNDLLDLKLSASYSDTSVEQRNASGTIVMGGPFTCAETNLFCDTDYGYQTWQFNAENTSEWQGESWKNYLTYGWQTSYQRRTAEAVQLSGGTDGITFHPEGTDFKTGLFVQDEFVWNERLTLIPGMRIDWHRLSPGDSTGISEDSEAFAFSPKIAAQYKFNDTFSVFGSFAHTERFPTIDEVYSTSAFMNVYLPSLDLKKERANNFEAGFAISGYDVVQAGDGVQLKATGFYNRITDLIDNNPAVSGFGFTNAPGYMNIANAEIYGAEVELAYDSDYVFAQAGYAYTVGKDKDTGDHLTSVAPHELSLTLGGKLPQHDLRFGWRARFAAAPQDSCRRSESIVVCAGDSSQGSTRFAEAFNVHDLFLTWKPGEGQFAGWVAQFGVDNVFNQQYKEFLHNEPAKGRTFKVSLSKQFGW